jgi:hypothetical protein
MAINKIKYPPTSSQWFIHVNKSISIHGGCWFKVQGLMMSHALNANCGIYYLEHPSLFNIELVLTNY